ncbi:MAG: hypothetical protein AAB534_01600 [Patescibacteria group bacterium]
MFRTKLKFKTSNIVKKRRKKIIIRIVLYFLLVVVFVGTLSLLSHAKFLGIKEIKTTGEEVVNTKEIIQIAENKIDGAMLGLFSKSNILLYPRYEIESDILSQFKRISDVTVSIEKFSILNIKILERQPFGLWCESSSDQISNEKCSYLDKTGFLFDDAPNFSGNSFVKYYTATSTESMNDYFLETKNFEDLNSFLNNVSKTFNVEIIKVINNRENLEIRLSGDIKLILNPENDFEKTFENLTALIDELEFQKEIDSLGSLEQINLQFGNKIFYKVR